MTLAMPIPSTPPPAPPSSLIPYPVRRFTVEEYHKMLEIGVLREGEPIELLEGWLIEKMTRGPGHDDIFNLLYQMMLLMLPKGWKLRGQSAITLSASEPEPDLAIVRQRQAGYRDRHPQASEVALVLEVAASSLDQDRGLKSRIYATAGIPHYWIVNVEARCVEVRSAPAKAREKADYTSVQTHRAGESVPLVIDGAAAGVVVVDEIFPS